MKSILRIAVISLTLMTISCTNQSDSKENSESNKNTYNIELVNDEKWEVNKEMMVHIKNMESDIEAVLNQSSPNYEGLGSRLLMPLGILGEVYLGLPPVFVLLGAIAMTASVLILGVSFFKIKS
ncbi:MAG: hypothetical protein R2799_14710 [Crocinitomicaceae bacterium]